MDIHHCGGDLAHIFLPNVKRSHRNSTSVQIDAGIVFCREKEEIFVRIVVPDGDVIGTQQVDGNDLVANQVIVPTEIHRIIRSIYSYGLGGSDPRIAQMGLPLWTCGFDGIRLSPIEVDRDWHPRLPSALNGN